MLLSQHNDIFVKIQLPTYSRIRKTSVNSLSESRTSAYIPPSDRPLFGSGPAAQTPKRARICSLSLSVSNSRPFT